jgi:hypothetical protein
VIHRRGVRLVSLGFEVLTIALLVEIAIRRRPLERVFADTAQIRGRLRQASDIAPATLDRAIRTAYRVLPFESTCLKHSLIFCRIRRRRGLPAELRIGVQKKDGVFGAHAWVEDGSGNVLTDPLEGFTSVPLRRPSSPDDRSSG